MSVKEVPTIANALFNGKLYYGIEHWSNISATEIEAIEKTREKAARISLGVNICLQKTRKQVFEKIKWDPIELIKKKVIVKETHKTLMTGSPTKKYKYMTNNRTDIQKESRKIKQFQPGFGLSNMTQNLPRYKAPSIFNSLPIEIREIQGKTKFKKAINKFYKTGITPQKVTNPSNQW